MALMVSLLRCSWWLRGPSPANVLRSSMAAARAPTRWRSSSAGPSRPPLYISGEEVRSLASMPELVRAMETAFRRLSGTGDGGGSDEVLQPVRSVVPVRQHAG